MHLLAGMHSFFTILESLFCMTEYWDEKSIQAVKDSLSKGEYLYSNIPADARAAVAEKLERGFATKKAFHVLVPDVRGGVSVLSIGRGGGACNNYPDHDTAVTEALRMTKRPGEWEKTLLIE